MRKKQYVVLGLLGLFTGSACTGTVDSNSSDDSRFDDGGSGGAGAGGSGGPSAPGLAPLDKVCSDEPKVGAYRWRRLTALQYRNSVKDLLDVEANTRSFLLDTKSGPFDSNSEIGAQAEDVENYRTAAEDVARQATAAAKLNKTLGCDVAKMGEDNCASAFIDSFGVRAYRHPLSASERAALQAVYKVGKEESFSMGIAVVVQSALQSPNFLYLNEFGDGKPVTKLKGYEVAARLSYLIWGSTPDADLFDAAARGELDSDEGIKKQTKRLLESSRSLALTTGFFSQLFDLGRLEQASAIVKDPTRYPGFNDAMKTAMAAESKAYLEHVFAKDDGTIETLLTAPYVFPTAPLSDIYGVTGKLPADGKFMAVGRSGFLTTAAVLAVHPHGSTLFPAVARGKVIRSSLLCTDLPPPAMASNFVAPPNAAMLSEQELNRRHRDDPSCSGCHALLEPVGFGLDMYDSLGKIRKTANDGSPIDGSGDLIGTDVEGPYKGPAELSQKLASSQDVRVCLAKQWLQYSLAREPSQDDECSLQKTAQILVQGRGDVKAAIMALVTTDAFRYRKGQ